LTGELKGRSDRLLFLEFNVTHAFGAVAHAILNDLGLGDRANLFKKLLELAGAEAGGELLYEDGATVSLVFGQDGRSGIAGRAVPARPTAATVVLAASIATVIVLATFFAAGAVVALRGARAGASTPTSAIKVPISASVTT